MEKKLRIIDHLGVINFHPLTKLEKETIDKLNAFCGNIRKENKIKFAINEKFL